MRTKLALLSILLAVGAFGNPAYPLKIEPGKHYLSDQNGQPVFVHGDAVWGISIVPDIPAVTQYLDDRKARGFNSIIVNLIDRFYSVQDETNLYNVTPFTNLISSVYWDFNSVNPRYFTNIDNILTLCAARNMQAFLFVCYLGSHTNSPANGYYLDMVASGKAACTNYGKFLANRYKDVPNIVWVGGGDHGDFYHPDLSYVDAITFGISGIDSNHLMTAHGPNGKNGFAELTGSWDKVNSVYTNYTPGASLDAYQVSPIAPALLLESTYEDGGQATPVQIRQFAWGSILSGCSGEFYGNMTNFEFSSGWQLTLSDSGGASLTYLKSMVNGRQWYRWVPDTNRVVCTSGYGTLGNIGYVSVASDVASNSVVAYLPQGSNQLPVIAMTKLLGPLALADASWFNPRTGATTAIGTFATSGTQTFQAPDTNDWVLTLDAQIVLTRLRTSATLNINSKMSLR